MQNNNRANFTCRKLSRKFEEETGEKVGKTTINKLIRCRLGLKYRNTSIKTSRVAYDKNIIISFAFIKVIARCIMQKFSIIYCDESSLQTKNDNLKLWRKPDDIIISNIAKRERLNLIMAVYENGVLYYEINKNNTDAKSFLLFMQALQKKINEQIKGPYIIVLDNLSAHKTKELYDFYIANKMNIIFNTPYLSIFNSIELSFRNLKREIYSMAFESAENMEEAVKTILNRADYNKSIYYNYRETLEQYLSYSNNNKNFDLNRAEY